MVWPIDYWSSQSFEARVVPGCDWLAVHLSSPPRRWPATIAPRHLHSHLSAPEGRPSRCRLHLLFDDTNRQFIHLIHRFNSWNWFQMTQLNRFLIVFHAACSFSPHSHIWLSFSSDFPPWLRRGMKNPPDTCSVWMFLPLSLPNNLRLTGA